MIKRTLSENKFFGSVWLKTLFISFFSLSLCNGSNNEIRIKSLLSDLNIESSAHIDISSVGNHIKIEYTLPKSCSDALNELLKGSAIDPYQNWESYCPLAQELLLKVLPEDLKSIIAYMSNNNEPTALIIHNMPVDSYIPQTPTHGNRPTHKEFNSEGEEISNPHAKDYVSETSLLGMCNLLNSYPDFDENEKDGTYINQIIPVDDIKNKQDASSFGSEVTFEFHTENVYQETPLKYLSLLCLRGDSKVATSLVFLDAILEAMKKCPHETMSYEEIIEEMEKPQYIMKTGPSFGDFTIQTQLPILCKKNNNERLFRFNANKGRVIGANTKAAEVVEYLRAILTKASFKEQSATRIYLKTGDLIILNNWEVMHSRDAFKIDPNNWRWLQRCYFMRKN